MRAVQTFVHSIAALAVFASMAAAPIAAQSCMPAELFFQMVRADPRYRSHVAVTGPDQIARAGRMFNAVPPPSDGEWTDIVLVELADGGGALLVGSDGTICGALAVSPPQWPAFRHAVLGDEASGK